jgi:hypothetical protein
MLEKGKLNTAIDLFSESLEIHKDTLGTDHMKTLACYYRLAWVCHRLGELQKAKQLLSDILEVYLRKEPIPKAEIARTKFKLSKILEDSGVPKSEWCPIRSQGQEYLVEISKSEKPDLESESEYDECIVYFLR